MDSSDLLLLALLIPGLLLIALIVAIALPRAVRDEKRLRNNLCLHCGYDLRECTGRCPECGRSRDEPLSPRDESIAP
jgi:predicted amidophosphoribosyltransferase